MFSTLGRNDDEDEEEEEELTDEEKDLTEEKESTDEEKLTKEEEEVNDKENEVKELEMELEELDSALQKGIDSSKGISIVDICNQLGEIDCIVNEEEDEKKVYDSFEEKLQNIFNSR